MNPFRHYFIIIICMLTNPLLVTEAASEPNLLHKAGITYKVIESIKYLTP